MVRPVASPSTRSGFSESRFPIRRAAREAACSASGRMTTSTGTSQADHPKGELTLAGSRPAVLRRLDLPGDPGVKAQVLGLSTCGCLAVQLGRNADHDIAAVGLVGCLAALCAEIEVDVDALAKRLLKLVCGLALEVHHVAQSGDGAGEDTIIELDPAGSV